MCASSLPTAELAQCSACLRWEAFGLTHSRCLGGNVLDAFSPNAWVFFCSIKRKRLVGICIKIKNCVFLLFQALNLNLSVLNLHTTWLFSFQYSYYSYLQKSGWIKNEIVALLIGCISVCKIIKYLKWCKTICIIPLCITELEWRVQNSYTTSPWFLG